jgi:folate-binding protein YgfZ
VTFAAFIPRDTVRAGGLDAASYLQGQLSQDVAALAVGDSAWSFALEPQGKVDAWFRVTRLAEDTFVLDVDGGWGDVLVRRLERFKLRVKVTIEVLDWRCVAVRGVLPERETLRATGAELLVPLDWDDQIGVDLLGASVALPAGVPPGTVDDYERWRVEHAMPRMGAEFDDRTIPAEAGVVDRSVSFTKGCYTGQELVARVDSRGSNTPRRLRAVTLDRPGASPGSAVMVAGRDAGVVTSVAGDRALAYVHRSVLAEGGAAGAAVEVTVDGIGARLLAPHGE